MSWRGAVEGIYIADTEGGPMRELQAAELITGRGIHGDRYIASGGQYAGETPVPPGHQITLIEAEAIEAVNAGDRSFGIDKGATRRNLLTRGVPLNHLVGRAFRVGEATLLGIELCEPCGHLEKLTELPGLRKALIHRGGLRAQIIEGGTIEPGAIVEPA